MPILFVYYCLLATFHSRSWGCVKLKGSYPILGSIGDAPLVSCDCLQRGSRGCVPGAPDASLCAKTVHALLCLFRARRREFISIIGRATVCELVLSSTPEMYEKRHNLITNTRDPKGRTNQYKARKNPNHEAIW